MGYIRGLVHGVVAGTVLGICIAPQPGDRTRAQLSAFGKAAGEAVEVAQRTVRQVAPMVTGVASLARSQVARSRHPEGQGQSVTHGNGQR